MDIINPLPQSVIKLYYLYAKHFDVSVLDIMEQLKIYREFDSILIFYKDTLHIVLNFNVIGKAPIDKMYSNHSPIILKESYVRRLCFSFVERLYFADGDMVFI